MVWLVMVLEAYGILTSTMQQFLNNRYVRMVGLALGLTLLFYILITLIFLTVGLRDFPQPITALFSLLAAGLFVYKLLSQRIV